MIPAVILNPNIRAALALVRTHKTECTCQQCTAVIDLASEHRYECKCELCSLWWERMGPEEDEGDD